MDSSKAGTQTALLSALCALALVALAASSLCSLRSPRAAGTAVALRRAGAGAPVPAGSGRRGAAAADRADTLVVVARYQEDVSWLDVYSGVTRDGIPHRVYTAGDPNATHPTPANKGNEAMAFLTAMLDVWDRPPAAMVLMHGHRSSHHQRRGNDWVLRHLRWPTREPYVSLQCHGSHEPRVFPARPEAAPWEYVQRQSRVFAAAWAELGWARYFGPVPERINCPCCAEFLVTGAAIRRLPRRFYEEARAWLMRTNLSDLDSGLYFENAWHIMFSEGHQLEVSNVPNCTHYLYGLEGLQEGPW